MTERERCTATITRRLDAPSHRLERARYGRCTMANEDTVMVSFRLTREQSEMLDRLADLYDTTKTDIVRQGGLMRAAEMAAPEAVEAQLEKFRQRQLQAYAGFRECFDAELLLDPSTARAEQKTPKVPAGGRGRRRG